MDCGKKSNLAGFLGDEIAEKSAVFAGIFRGKLGRKAIFYWQITADFVVIFRANFARNQSVLR